MNHSWLIIIFVATIVCNTHSRPQAERVRNYYRVHEPPKDQDKANANRYDKSRYVLGGAREEEYRTKRDVDPVALVRIDIPHNKTRRAEVRAIESNSTDPIDGDRGSDWGEIEFVPVSISKSSGVKKWPSGQNGIESVDDLHLYNTYTSSVNDKIKPQGEYGGQSPVVPYISNKKPAIIIIEELTMRPHYPSPSRPTAGYTYTPIEVITYRPEGTRPSYFGSSHPSYTTPRPIYPSVVRPPVLPVSKPKPVCPSVTITATNTVINNNKEGCNDIKINIESVVHNVNNLTSAVQDDPHPVTVTPVVSVTTERPDDDGQLFGINFGDLFGSLGSVLTTFSGLSLINPISLTFLSTIFSPVLLLLAGGVGIAAIVLPCAIFSGRNQGRNRFVILRNRMDKPKRYVYGVSKDGSKQYLKRTTRSVLSIPYRGHLHSGRRRRRFCLTYCLNRKGHARGSYNCDNCRFGEGNPTACCPPYEWWMTDGG